MRYYKGKEMLMSELPREAQGLNEWHKRGEGGQSSWNRVKKMKTSEASSIWGLMKPFCVGK